MWVHVVKEFMIFKIQTVIHSNHSTENNGFRICNRESGDSISVNININVLILGYMPSMQGYNQHYA